MSPLRIFGKPASRTFRVIWCAEELGLQYEIVPIQSADDSMKSAEYLAVNPNGKIPALADGDLVLFESIAINCYLAKRYGADRLWPSTATEEALALQWSFWAVAELEGPFITIMMNRGYLPRDQRDRAAAQAAEVALQPGFAVLDAALAGTGQLIGDKFTIADLNVAGVLSWATSIGRIELGAYPNLVRWLHACYSRPAAMRVNPLPS